MDISDWNNTAAITGERGLVLKGAPIRKAVYVMYIIGSLTSLFGALLLVIGLFRSLLGGV